MKDWISGEEVSYQHDSLSRLISAVTTGLETGGRFRLSPLEEAKH